MIWVSAIGAALVFAIGVLMVAYLHRRDSDLAWEVRWQGSAALLATLSGVFIGATLALYFQERSTTENLVGALRVALSEAEANLERLEKAQGGDMSLDDRLIAERPAAALETLTSMPAFLQYGDPGRATELIQLNTQLVGRPVPGGTTTVPGGGGYSAVPLPKIVERLKRVAWLLREQIRNLGGSEPCTR